MYLPDGCLICVEFKNGYIDKKVNTTHGKNLDGILISFCSIVVEIFGGEVPINPRNFRSDDNRSSLPWGIALSKSAQSARVAVDSK